jgi:hypothetical protein
MTDEYFSGSGHPIGVDSTGRSNKFEVYDDNKHGNAIVMCTVLKDGCCHNDEIKVKHYEQHLYEVHNITIDPVQKRLMQSSAMVKPSIRKSKYVWAPFIRDIPATIYIKHMEELNNEKANTTTKSDQQQAQQQQP